MALKLPSFLLQNHKNRPAVGVSGPSHYVFRNYASSVIRLICIRLFYTRLKSDNYRANNICFWFTLLSKILVACLVAFTQARSQKFAMGGCCEGLGAKPPAAVAPSARKFCIFLQKSLNFRAILIKNNAFKTWHRNWQRNMIQLVALMGYMGIVNDNIAILLFKYHRWAQVR